MLRALRSPFAFPVFRALPASVLLLSALVLPALAQRSAPAPAAAPPFLPTDFAGWSLSAPAQESTAPEIADAANAAVLKEYGFQQFSSAHYANGDNKLNVRAIRFQDASGAFGAFTFYRRPGSMAGQICPTAPHAGVRVPGASQGSASASGLGKCCSSAARLSPPSGTRPWPHPLLSRSGSLRSYRWRATRIRGGLWLQCGSGHRELL